jgi:hypothetical protein
MGVERTTKRLPPVPRVRRVVRSCRIILVVKQKVRIAQGGKKGKARLDAESTHPPTTEGFAPNVKGGYRLKNDNGMRWSIPGFAQPTLPF